MAIYRRLLFVAMIVALAGLVAPTADSGEKPRSPVQVTIREDKPIVLEPVLPIDPVQRIQFNNQMNMCPSIQAQTQPGRQNTLHLSYFPTLKIDERVLQIGMGQVQFVTQNAPLPKSPAGKERKGFMSVCKDGDLYVTMTAELTSSKPPKGQPKRRLDAVLIRYEIENKGKQPHKVGLRVYMDAYCIDNDGAQFAAPTMPGQVLNGIELKGKTMPDYVQKLQRPNLKDPGFIAHISLNMGGAGEKANRIILTQHGTGFGTWDMPAQKAFDTAVGIFWDPKEIKPGSKRTIAYAYGEGLAIAHDNEGQVQVKLSGSFEPGKLFTVAATVHDPVPGQALTLELPAGIERVEGKENQPVPAPLPDQGQSLVMWKCRVQQLGDFPIRHQRRDEAGERDHS